MEYSIKQLAELAGVSTRTLRYYGSIGLLVPSRITESGYRFYESGQVNRLQQILLYRQMGMGLAQIKEAVQQPDFNRLAALRSQLAVLKEKQKDLALMISTVQKSIEEETGGTRMKDTEKFEGLKRALAEENDKKYGAEIARKYGKEKVQASSAKFLSLSAPEMQRMEALGENILRSLAEAVREHQDPAGEKGQQIAAMHREWLGFTWPDYTPQAHLGLAQMYVDDARFTAYYDGEQEGCAKFLLEAIKTYVNSQA